MIDDAGANYLNGAAMRNDCRETRDIDYLIKSASDCMKARGDRELAAVGLTFSQMRVLCLLADASGGGAVSPSDVERILGVSQPTVAGLVKRLEQKGFLRVSTAAQDRRCRVLELTEEGAHVAAGAVSERSRREEELLKGFTEQEVARLTAMLERLLDNLGQRAEGEA